MVATIRRQETTEQALSRLAGKARHEGVRLQLNPRTGQYFATSGTTAGKRYAVTGFSCECHGFATHGRCKHYAALMAALGFLPQSGEAAPADPCRSCEGRGYHIKARQVGRGQFVREDVPCPACQGAGTARKAVA